MSMTGYCTLRLLMLCTGQNMNQILQTSNTNSPYDSLIVKKLIIKINFSVPAIFKMNMPIAQCNYDVILEKKSCVQTGYQCFFSDISN